MLLDSESARTRLESPDNLINRLSIPSSSPSSNQPSSKVTIIEKDRPGGKRPELPRFLRTQIAIAANLGTGAQKDIAQMAGTTQPEVSFLKNGKVKGLDEEAIEKVMGPVRDRALEKLMSSMGMITDDKLEKCKPLELSTIAANMSRVVEKTMPKEQVNQANTGANIIIYAPKINSENSYEVVEV
jgi:hypothetical protein